MSLNTITMTWNIEIFSFIVLSKSLLFLIRIVFVNGYGDINRADLEKLALNLESRNNWVEFLLSQYRQWNAYYSIRDLWGMTYLQVRDQNSTGWLGEQ